MNKKSVKSVALAVFGVACLWSSMAVAVPVTGLYAATAVVDDQDPATRRAAMPALLQQVVGRLVGEPDPRLLLQRWPELNTALSKPENYLEQFLYQRIAGESQQLRLRVEFDERALGQLVQRLNLPQWGRDRPEVLTVIAWEGDGRRAVLASAPSSLLAADLLAELQRTAQNSGLPIAVPLMDLQDQRDLPFVEIRAGFYDRVLDAAARYGADAVLVGRLKMAAGGDELAQRETDVKWSLLQRDAQPQHAAHYGPLSNTLEAGLWMATRTLAQRYAVSGSNLANSDQGLGADTGLSLHVLGINNFASLKAVEKHLQSRSVVASAQLSRMSETQGQILAVFRLALKGDVTKFEQALRVGRMLSPTVPPNASDADLSTANPNAAEPNMASPVNSGLWYRLAR